MNRLRQLHNDERGIAMAVVILSLLVVSIVVGVMFNTVLAEQTSTRTQRNVTNARQAAEAGVDEVVYKLSQGTAYAQSAGGVDYSGTVGKGSYTAHVVADVAPNTNDRIITAIGTYNGNTRSLKVTVTLNQPGLNEAMYAANDINFHNHGGPLSISVATNNIYAGGDITVNYPSQFRINDMAAQGEVDLSDNGGDATKVGTPAGSGYFWSYALTGQPTGSQSCWPGPALGAVTNGVITEGPTAGACSGTPPKYSGNATVMGTIEANKVVIDSHGNTLASAVGGKTVTGQTLDPTSGSVTAGSATIGGTSYTSNGTYGSGGSSCPNCSYTGASSTGGKIAGTLSIQSGFKPKIIPFPDISYDTYKGYAETEQGSTCGVAVPSGGVQHCFTGANAGPTFVSYITSGASGHNFYRTVDPTTGLMGTWPAGTLASQVTMPDVIFLDGDWYITGDDLALAYNTIETNARAAACAAQAARGQASCTIPAAGTNGAPDPYIVVRGSLVIATGGLTLTQGLMVVGPGNAVNFLRKPSCCTSGTNNVPFSVDLPTFLSSDTNNTATAGLLAVGTKIDAKDGDQDVGNASPWSGTYNMGTAAPAFIRGVVINATWNGTHLVPGQEQHWHVFDPKNIMRLYGAEIGGKLHNCNNFQFTYDPIVKGIRGQGGSGTIQIKDYQEIR
jgi:hypothetical protein